MVAAICCFCNVSHTNLIPETRQTFRLYVGRGCQGVVTQIHADGEVLCDIGAEECARIPARVLGQQAQNRTWEERNCSGKVGNMPCLYLYSIVSHGKSAPKKVGSQTHQKQTIILHCFPLVLSGPGHSNEGHLFRASPCLWHYAFASGGFKLCMKYCKLVHVSSCFSKFGPWSASISVSASPMRSRWMVEGYPESIVFHLQNLSSSLKQSFMRKTRIVWINI